MDPIRAVSIIQRPIVSQNPSQGGANGTTIKKTEEAQDDGKVAENVEATPSLKDQFEKLLMEYDVTLLAVADSPMGGESLKNKARENLVQFAMKHTEFLKLLPKEGTLSSNVKSIDFFGIF